MIEVEQKYGIDDPAAFIESLQRKGAEEQSSEAHSDTYFNHPCRDFGETREALRVRRVNGKPMVTYKGTILPGSVKARRELEWPLDPGDHDGSHMESLLEALGFRRVATVSKQRRSFGFRQDSTGFTIVVDEVDGLGHFAEIELIVEDSSAVEAARSRILELGQQLGLLRPERRSYLTLILESRAS